MGRMGVVSCAHLTVCEHEERVGERMLATVGDKSIKRSIMLRLEPAPPHDKEEDVYSQGRVLGELGEAPNHLGRIRPGIDGTGQQGMGST